MCNKITIQPFIENAIYHGLDRMVDAGEIRICVRADGKDIIITVADNGLGMTKEQCETILKKAGATRRASALKMSTTGLKSISAMNTEFQSKASLMSARRLKLRFRRLRKDGKMNIKRSIAFMLLASFLLCVLFGCESGSGFAPEYPRVAIIIKGSESDFWNDVKRVRIRPRPSSTSISPLRGRRTRRITRLKINDRKRRLPQCRRDYPLCNRF